MSQIDTRRYIFSSVTRISDLPQTGDFEVQPLPRSDWAGGQYVIGRVTGAPTPLYQVELPDGRMTEVLEGDLVVGAFGKRAATLEGVGDWDAIREDGVFHALTGAGLFGRATSTSPVMPRMMSLSYVGHVLRAGQALTMQGFVVPAEARRLDAPVILLVGTSMSSGKTTAGRLIIHELTRSKRRIVGAKLTGAGRYRDILAYRDAGADAVLDFVDAGLPSTVVSCEVYEQALRLLLNRIAALNPDLVVVEAGASPLEPYNGDVAIDALQKQLKMTVLAASDPYAVVGVQTAFGLVPDLVTGPAANTSAGIELVEKLAGRPALNLLDPAALPQLRALLRERFPELLADTGGD